MDTIAMTIAGSDSGGGAGVQADIKTFQALGVHGTCAITALTSQNTTGVKAVFDVPLPVIASQIDAVMADFDVRYAKTGMLSRAETVRLVADKVRQHGLKVVVDPVMAAEAGGRLLNPDAVDALKHDLLPLAEVTHAERLRGRRAVGYRDQGHGLGEGSLQKDPRPRREVCHAHRWPFRRHRHLVRWRKVHDSSKAPWSKAAPTAPAAPTRRR